MRTGESAGIQFTTLERQQSAGITQQSNTSVLPTPTLKIQH